MTKRQGNRNQHNKDKTWVSDVTEFHHKNVSIFICVVIDLYARKVIGCRLADAPEPLKTGGGTDLSRIEGFRFHYPFNWSGRRHLNRRESAAFLRPYDTDPKLNTKRFYHLALAESIRPKNVITVFQRAGEFCCGQAISLRL